MSIEYFFEVKEERLIVQTSGVAKNLEDTFEYALAIIEMAVKSNSTKILCDERNLAHQLGVIDTVSLAEKTRAAAPGVARVAVVVSDEDLENVKFYETATNNRGLIIIVTSDYSEAEDWLK